ncbi:MAG: glycosyltransferase family 39 protein [Anaerolineae bacterium]|nr:glycosyltransferase family 39 protein [Anaerolineae bacterium]
MTRSRTFVVILLVLLTAAALRITLLGQKAVWWDEAWSVWTAQQPFGQTSEITARDVHPPLYQWMLHGWVRVAGISELAARYPSTLLGLLTVAMVYPLTIRLGGKRTALLAVFFIALSTFHIHWSQEARMYALAAFFTALACYAYLRVSQPHPKSLSASREGLCGAAESPSLPVERGAGGEVKWWLVLILAGAAIPLTHYLGAFVLIILNLHWLLTIRLRPRAFHVRWIGAMIVIGLIFAVWLIYALPQMRSGGGDSGFPANLVFQLSSTLLAAGTSINLDQYVWPTLIVIVVLAVGLLLYTRRNRANALLIWLMVLFPPMAIYGMSLPGRAFYAPKPEERYLVIFAPVIYAGFGLALHALRSKVRVLGIAAGIALTLLYGYAIVRDLDARYFRDDYATMLRTVNTLARPDEPVFFVSEDRYPLVYYHLNRAAGWQSPLTATGIKIDGDNLDDQMNRYIGSAPRFWVIEIEKHLGDPQNRIIPWLDQHFKRVYHVPIDYNGVSLYARSDSTAPTSDQLLKPRIDEARPGDVMRIGVGGHNVDLLYDGKIIVPHNATPSWEVIQFPIYAAYPPGFYTLRVDSFYQYDFRVTHSQGVTNGVERNLNAQLGPFHLLGYSASSRRVRPGDTLAITFYWQADQQATENYTVFSHLLGGFNPATNSIVWANHDSYPAETPTRAWWPGLIAADHRLLKVPADAPTGPYAVEVGLYQLDTGQRLKQPNGADTVIIEGFEVTN